ncbi:DeoR/GlpR family DNA-binding transcription regulator [Aquabacterium sp.]|uniref:DeoR/GlpR family DNA-binding transcription regulator n=1 Tax=Aquabacterium sp. TaxID=1872578 RepID=UPI002BCDA4B3|nr:DeoR/GlpR family DNA-binding transcription regulator [Aquabacterium sp.]HSW03466.1 DeoR/GlpR family DNA-binding transcription regulator [Aquabacterium sp.]
MSTLSGTAAREARWRQLQTLFAARGALPLAHAAEALQVSAMTIRRDLAGPEAPLSCLGGYVVAALAPAAARYTLDEEADQHAPHKRLACRRAAEQVQAGDSLFIDCGTTMPHLAEALPPDIALNVVCYSLNIATILSRRPNTQLMLLGGLYHASSASFSSDEAVAYLRRLGVNKAFISAGGVHAERGASCANFHEVPVKQAAIASAAESFLVVDDSKLGRLRPAFFSPLARFSRIIVGGAPSPTMRTQFKGLKLEVAAAPSSATAARRRG